MVQITSDIELSGAGCTTAITPNQLVQSSSENDIHAQPVRELDHRPHDSLVTGIIREPGDKGLVDFQCGDGAAFQMLQAGIAGAEVVGGEAHADGAQKASKLANRAGLPNATDSVSSISSSAGRPYRPAPALPRRRTLAQPGWRTH
ncbi:hypothetical protein [Escherichia coli]|uniref:hypothetical protein n=1 Tax=Escherichia coli TaxID=562 RepID=UPI003CC90E70